MHFNCSRLAKDRIETILSTLWDESLEPGTWIYKGKLYTFKQGYDQYDGSLTGVVYEKQPTGEWKSKGSAKINPYGVVVKFPFIPMELKVNDKPANIESEQPPRAPLVPSYLQQYIKL